MMSSGRGPGLIGMLLALVVLFGFGALYVLVFDERLRGSDRTIESILVEQEREIRSLGERLANGTRQIDFRDERLEENQVLAEQLAANRSQVRRIAELVSRRDLAEDGTAGVRREFDAYRRRYREIAGLEAVGERFERLTLEDGHILHDVEIRAADEIGLSLLHAAGLQRIPYKDLPREMRVRFDRDPVSTATAATAGSEPAEEEAAAGSDPPPRLETRRERLVREIAMKEREIRAHQAAMRELDTHIRLAAEDASTRAAAGRPTEGGDRVAMLRSRRQSREAEIGRLREEIARLRRGL